MKLHARQTPFVIQLLVPLSMFGGQTTSSPAPAETATKEISSMITRLLTAFSRDVGGGVIASWPALPTDADLAKVRSYGDAAVQALEGHIRSPDIRESRLAIRLLSANDEKRSAPILLDLAASAQMQVATRETALRFLRDVNDARVDDLLRKLAATDAEERVRVVAKEILCARAKDCS